MIKHIVLFELSDELSHDEKACVIQRVKEAFEQLPERIECLRCLRIAPNLNPSESYDFALIADLDTMQDVKTYAEHSEHVTLVSQMIKPHLKARAAVDIELK